MVCLFKKITSLLLVAGLLMSPVQVLAQGWTDDGAESQDNSSDDPFGADPFHGIDEEVAPSTQPKPTLKVAPEPPRASPAAAAVQGSSKTTKEQPISRQKKRFSDLPTTPNGSAVEYSTTPNNYDAAMESEVQNAIIEGVQLTAEPGERPDEKIVSGYFIFRDKPSSYFYETKLREKKLIFEFNDTRIGSSPVPTAVELPIKGFLIEQGKVDVNKAVKGLKPEWHDLIRVVFDLEAVPQVHVNDEYSIISFSFKWTSDPSRVAKYTVKDKTPRVIFWSVAGVGSVAIGAVVAFLLNKPPVEPELAPLSKTDLPDHKTTLVQ